MSPGASFPFFTDDRGSLAKAGGTGLRATREAAKRSEAEVWACGGRCVGGGARSVAARCGGHGPGDKDSPADVQGRCKTRRRGQKNRITPKSDAVRRALRRLAAEAEGAAHIGYTNGSGDYHGKANKTTKGAGVFCPPPPPPGG